MQSHTLTNNGSPATVRETSTGNPVDPLVKVSVMALLFFLPAEHTILGRAAYWAVGLNPAAAVTDVVKEIVLPTNLLCAFIIFLRLLARDQRLAFGKRSMLVLGILLVWLIGAGVSYFLNPISEVTTAAFGAVYMGNIPIFLALLGLRHSSRDLRHFVIALSLGTAWALAPGPVVFYQDWGIPDFLTLIEAHERKAEIKRYEDMTFGNVGNSSAFVMLVGWTFASVFLQSKGRLLLRAWLGFVLGLCLLHLLIGMERAALILTFAGAFVFFSFYRRFRIANWLGKAWFAIVILFFLSDFHGKVDFTERLMYAITINRDQDASVQGRYESILEGWEHFVDSGFLGKGPGSMLEVHSMTSAHQLFVQQAAETGILGLLAITVLAFILVSRAGSLLRRGARSPNLVAQFVWNFGPVLYLAYGIIANVPLFINTENIWSGLLTAFLALSDPCCFVTSSEIADSSGAMV